MESQKNIDIMKDKQGFFRKGERKRMFEACKTQRDALLIRILWKSGRRISEVLNLRVEEINFDEGIILWHILKKRVKINKNSKRYKRKEHMVWKPMDKKTLQMLNNYITFERLKPDDFIFYSRVYNKCPITRQAGFQIIRRIAKRAGIIAVGSKKPHPHHFRHSLAVDIARKIRNPAEMRQLQQFLEHDDIQMTMNYLEFRGKEMGELLESIGDEE